MTVCCIFCAILSGLILFWIYFGYSYFIRFLAGFIRKEVKKDLHFQPRVSLLIMAFNEESVIRKKIENSLQLNYPAEKLEIVVVDSCSTDKTAGICREYSQIKLIQEEERRGKSMAVKFGMEHASGEIIVVTDANAFYDPNALRELIANFADPVVGGVTGAFEQRTESSQSGIALTGEEYWKRERMLRRYETKLHSVIALSGEMSAFRKAPAMDIQYYSGADDFDMTLHLIKKGYRIIYEPKAKAWEKAADNLKDFMDQRIKVIAMAITVTTHQMFSVIFNPRYGLYGMLILPSRRSLPLLSPFLLLLLFLSTCYTALSLFSYSILAFAVIQAVAPVSLLAINHSKIPILNLIAQFYLMNWLIVRAWYIWICGKRFMVWEKVESTR